MTEVRLCSECGELALTHGGVCCRCKEHAIDVIEWKLAELRRLGPDRALLHGMPRYLAALRVWSAWMGWPPPGTWRKSA